VQERARCDQQALGDQLAEAHARVDGLERSLRQFDLELEGLAGERERYRLLHEICGALDELGDLGAGELFWGGEGVAESRGRDQVRLSRGRLEAFEGRLGEIERRRQAVLDEIKKEHDSTEILEDEFFEAQREAEERKLEWMIEREDVRPQRAVVMPWTRGGEDDQRFRKALAATLLLSLLLGLLLPYIDLPGLEHWQASEVPERFTRMIRAEPVQPPPVVELTRAEEKQETVDESVVAEKKAVVPVPQKAVEKSAKSKGILAFREQFSSLADSKPAARLGAQARIRRSGEAAAGRPQRSMVATQRPGSSGGINIAALSRDVGGGGDGQIEGVAITQATSAIGAIAGPERPLSEGPGLSRTDEEIQIVFDRHKAALYRLYNRELRKNPTLRGQMVLRMRIEPDGSVSLCEVHSSDMKAPTLATQVVDRVKTFDFGAKDGIPAITILYPIDFLPAA